MGMPMDLYLVRHGESEANVIQEQGRQGDYSRFTEEYLAIPDRGWRLSAKGREQARCIGTWLQGKGPAFDRYLVSPYMRARETAVELGLPGAHWCECRLMRERSLGEIDNMRPDDYEEVYHRNAVVRRGDPLYWSAPAGETLAQVAEVRAQGLINWLQARAEGQSVIAVSHGDFMHTLMLLLEDLPDEEFIHRISSHDWDFHNCICLHYSRRDPHSGHVSATISHVQASWPVPDPESGQWTVHSQPWRSFEHMELTNEELAAVVRAQEPHM
ncbi:histidine phosphatase family protein [Bifidobacterium aemilianum]|uniref:Histidine phosphatase family protein n=1 Tax=Bifidobacterium aemilianum TaxID=2493120 RepID=A0A366K8T5_9BIFI|nr:histidine phosphatase family protein [Bifidobacterium aemilianum]RBP98126.1 histidine phosphatase family protein [Bifidobacterium aemilianum]